MSGGRWSSGRRGRLKGGRRLANQDRDRVLELGPLHGDVGGLHPGRIELRLGLRHVRLRRPPALETSRRERSAPSKAFTVSSSSCCCASAARSSK